jgi:hypothetical protein
MTAGDESGVSELHAALQAPIAQSNEARLAKKRRRTLAWVTRNI